MLTVSVSSTENLPVSDLRVEALLTDPVDHIVATSRGSAPGQYDLDVPQGDYHLRIEGAGYVPVAVKVRVDAGPSVVRVGVTRATDDETELSSLRGRVTVEAPDAKRIWVDLEPLFGRAAWADTYVHNMAVGNGGAFSFPALRAGLYTLLVLKEKSSASKYSTQGYQLNIWELMHAEVLRIDGDTEITLDGPFGSVTTR
jgi:hypothetical protein